MKWLKNVQKGRSLHLKIHQLSFKLPVFFFFKLIFQKMFTLVGVFNNENLK